MLQSLRRREPSRKNIADAMSNFGWFNREASKNRIVFERGRQRIEVKRVSKVNRWKVEYYSGRVMGDTTGLEEEHLAKRDAVEMGIGK